MSCSLIEIKLIGTFGGERSNTTSLEKMIPTGKNRGNAEAAPQDMKQEVKTWTQMSFPNGRCRST